MTTREDRLGQLSVSRVAVATELSPAAAAIEIHSMFYNITDQ